MLVVADGDVPDIIPPVTQLQRRLVPHAAVASSAKHYEQARGDGGFMPRMTVVPSHAAAAAAEHIQQASKPKRYSTQRQRLAVDAETADLSYDIPSANVAAPQSPATETTFYGTHHFPWAFVVQLCRLE